MTDPGGTHSGDGVLLDTRRHSLHELDMERTGPATLAQVMSEVEARRRAATWDATGRCPPASIRWTTS